MQFMPRRCRLPPTAIPVGVLPPTPSPRQPQAYDFRAESFTDAYSVANRSVELLMRKAGIDCGCEATSDKDCLQRYEATLKAEQSGG